MVACTLTREQYFATSLKRWAYQLPGCIRCGGVAHVALTYTRTPSDLYACCANSFHLLPHVLKRRKKSERCVIRPNSFSHRSINGSARSCASTSPGLRRINSGWKDFPPGVNAGLMHGQTTCVLVSMLR